MILELVSDPETDIVSALELKCWDGMLGKFENDPRVHNALEALGDKVYDLYSDQRVSDQMAFLDDAWVSAYLMDNVGRSKDAQAIRANLLSYFDPFQSYNPVTKGLAYCEAIENACSVDQLLATVRRMDCSIKGSEAPILQKLYCFLNKIAEMRLTYFKRSAYAVKVLKDINSLIDEGDALARNWDISEASYRYKRAAELAEYHLENYELAKKLENRLKDLEPELLDGACEDPDVDGVLFLEDDTQEIAQEIEPRPKQEYKNEPPLENRVGNAPKCSGLRRALDAAYQGLVVLRDVFRKKKKK